MNKLILRVLAILLNLLVAIAAANPKDDSNFFFDSKTGEGLKFTDIVSCTFERSSPDGMVVHFFPTNKGNLMAIPKNGSTGGKPFTYKLLGTTEKGTHRVYGSGDVKVFVHRDKPTLVTFYGEDQFLANCEKIIPKKMTE